MHRGTLFATVFYSRVHDARGTLFATAFYSHCLPCMNALGTLFATAFYSRVHDACSWYIVCHCLLFTHA